MARVAWESRIATFDRCDRFAGKRLGMVSGRPKQSMLLVIMMLMMLMINELFLVSVSVPVSVGGVQPQVVKKIAFAVLFLGGHLQKKMSLIISAFSGTEYEYEEN